MCRWVVNGRLACADAWTPNVMRALFLARQGAFPSIVRQCVMVREHRATLCRRNDGHIPGQQCASHILDKGVGSYFQLDKVGCFGTTVPILAGDVCSERAVCFLARQSALVRCEARSKICRSESTMLLTNAYFYYTLNILEARCRIFAAPKPNRMSRPISRW